MSNVVEVITKVGCIQCAQCHTPEALYVTITDNASTTLPYNTVRLLTEQKSPDNQTWCLVKTHSMQQANCFILCSHPSMKRVLVATKDPVEGYVDSMHLRIEELDRPIEQGKPLPIRGSSDDLRLYQFRMEQDTHGGYYLVSLSRIFDDTVVQAGFQAPTASNTPPNVNDFVNIHQRQRIMRELFYFQIHPNKL